ncbi:hypothetical protein [Actinoplanes palleronii]|uniref:Adhesin domain-containing protein n=1 Tax=Actinoplanes palleronii TaxID=113570 RepID=A0ABQ4BAV9_9ACTN|nr:hypothetical protein [Actinoplanes palleronii]GIE67725.1 hypothetical protein Apa02nite_038330 [Actinoplanes palleronii]
MTSATSLAASVAAIGFAGVLGVPGPAFAGAPAPCAGTQRYAAQSEAELLRIERLDLRGVVKREHGAGITKRDSGERPTVTPSSSPAGGEAGGAVVSDSDTQQLISGVGLGDSRSVMIADAPVKSAAAGLILNGRVPGAPAAEQVLQQAPPSRTKATEQHTGVKRFGPIQVDSGAMSAQARWDATVGCGASGGDISRSTTELGRITLTGANGELVRVPEKASSRSSTALNRRDGHIRSVASATVNTGRIDLAGGKVRIRILRAPTLRVSMSAADGGQVRYQPAVVEVSGPGISGTKLDTPSDQVDVTISDLGPTTESGTVPVLPPESSPVPSIPGLPVPSKSASSGPGAVAPLERVPGGKAIVRISLGEVRQASKGRALAARATAIKVSVLRVSAAGRGEAGYEPSAVVADLGIGMLEAAAVAPEPGRKSVATDTSADTLPVTGPRVAPLFITGAGLLVGGVCAFVLGARRRRPEA